MWQRALIRPSRFQRPYYSLQDFLQFYTYLIKFCTVFEVIKFGRPAPQTGPAAGRGEIFLASPYYSQRAVFASPLSVFFCFVFTLIGFICCWILINLI